ncbi:MAG: prepilin-type N-terminal cleavage/methylation domain-containing protein [Thiogranum sp.]|nr:prepilin-type N-terminal cleavage/methylation domain-containing protein [Thiogranum sp.]
MAYAASKGFTLMEMVITLTMLAIMVSVAGPYLSLGAQAYNQSAASIDTLGKLRNASERLTREIREIRRLPSGDYDVTLGANPLVFTKRDGETVTIDVAPPVVTLSYDDSVPGVTPVLTDEVVSLAFRYLRADGTTDASVPGEVAYIEFELVLDPAPAGNPYSQRGRVALRNQQ